MRMKVNAVVAMPRIIAGTADNAIIAFRAIGPRGHPLDLSPKSPSYI